MENQGIDLNMYIKVEILTEDEANDSAAESHIANIELEADSPSEPNTSLVKAEAVHEDLSEETTGSNENDYSKNDSVKDCEQIPQPAFVAFKEDLNLCSEDALGIPHPFNSENLIIQSSDMQTSLSGWEGNLSQNVKLDQELLLEEKNELEADNSGKPYSCGECLKRFRSKSGFTQHLQWHINRKFYVCEYCNKTFYYVTDYNKHVLVHTGEKPFRCLTCNKGFRQVSHLREHLYLHSEQRAFKCDECFEGFKNRSALRKHQKVHTVISLFRCEHCGEQFRRKENLKYHMSRHTGHIDCITCGQTFQTREAMRKHEKEHKFVCKICAKAFPYRHALRRHSKRHNDKSYICSYCSKSFAVKQDLRRHLVKYCVKRKESDPLVTTQMPTKPEPNMSEDLK